MLAVQEARASVALYLSGGVWVPLDELCLEWLPKRSVPPRAVAPSGGAGAATDARTDGHCTPRRRHAQSMRRQEEITMATALSEKERALIDAYWRAANYLSVGQIYLYDNPLLKQSLTKEHIKPRLLGHWGTTPGLNFIYVHLELGDQEARPRHDLHHRPRSWRSWSSRKRLPRGDLQRGLSEHFPR